MKKWRLLGIVLVAFIVGVVGCPEAQNMMKPVVTDEPADTTPPVTVGEVKKPEDKPATKPEKPTEPAAPADTTPPTVVKVAWYGDEQMTQSLTADSVVRPKDTVYTVVTFSEPVVHTVADDKAARPVLYIVIDGKTRRYKMLPHGADLRNSEAKPLHGETTDYLCKYTIPADTVGTPALQVGSATADTAGNRIAEASVHTAPFVVREPVIEPPSPVITEPVTEPMSQERQTPQERSEEIVKKIIYLQNEEPVINNYDLMIEVLEQESGLEYLPFIYGTLFRKIYVDERPEEKDEPFSWYDTVLEYLRLSFLYPNASEKELLAHFRQSVRDGRVEIDPNKSSFMQKRKDESKRLRENIPDIFVVKKAISKRETAALKQWKEDPSFDLNAERDKIFKEEAGLSFDFVHNTLMRIYLEENPDDQEIVDSEIYLHSHLISFYLLYKKTYEEESEEQILKRIREVSSKDGFVSIDLGEPLGAL